MKTVTPWKDDYLDGITAKLETEAKTKKPMKKYVFSFLNFHDCDLTSKVIESDLDAFEVAYEEMTGRGGDFEDFTDVNTIDDLKKYAFNGDCMFEIIEVHANFHTMWTACVGSPDYDKKAWQNVQNQLYKVGIEV